MDPDDRALNAPCRVLSADPPWPFRDKLPGAGRGASKHYDCLAIEQIKAFPLPPIAEDAALVLWRVGAMVPQAYDVARAWGFEAKAELVWLKRRRCHRCQGEGVVALRGGTGTTLCSRCNGDGSTRAFGMGRQTRAEHETAIIATRGKSTRWCASVRSTFPACMPEDDKGKIIHSAKPDEAYAAIERLYPGPYTELFARRPRAGWLCFGNELAGGFANGR